MEVTPGLSKEERQFRLVLRLSAVIYAAAGLAFAIAPEWILGLINSVGDQLVLFQEFNIPTTPNKFWVSLTFSMMMTITLLCYLAQRNVRKAVGYVGALLTAKLASTLSALCFFIFFPYFGYLVIVLMDGSIFLMTLYFFFRANQIFFETQTAYLRKAPVNPKKTPATKVVVLTGEDKFDLLDRVLAESGFFETLEKRFQEVGKTREAFSVVVKPNFMFMHAKKDISGYTDPELVEALIDKIVDRGFTKVSVVESQSTYGNYYHNREVANVAKYIGYSGKNYRIVDLTIEKEPHNYEGRLGQHWVGPTWRDADFRISFAKNKTHVFSHYTLTLKNIYGTLPLQNKVKEYHTDREYDWPTIETMKHFPVHFGLIDAFVSADGPFGVIVCNDPKDTKTIIGGENLIAVDYVGAKKMRLDPCDPRVGRFLPLAVEAFGRPERIEWVGDKSYYEPWQNVNEPLLQFLDLIEEAYEFANWWFLVLTAMDDHFPLKKQSWGTYAMRKILAPAKRIYYLYDDLRV
jgi:uncharacterized protein (DUF362 family)